MLAGFIKGITAVTFVAMLSFATDANAGLEVNYQITGRFSQSNTNVATFGTGTTAVTITFTGETVEGVELDPVAFVPFGNFKVTTSRTTDFDFDGLAPGNDDFTLIITQTSPTPTGGNPATFQSEINGKVRRNSSGAYIQFSQPLTQPMTFLGGTTFYSIVSADGPNPSSPTPGRINLVAPNVTGGATLQGAITAVPEPATVVSLLAGVPLLGIGAWARRRITRD